MTDKPFTFMLCNPWESYIQQIIEQNEREYRIHQLENDLQWEEDNGLHDYETDVEEVPVELLPEVQR